jgi:hypothetical protein
MPTVLPSRANGQRDRYRQLRSMFVATGIPCLRACANISIRSRTLWRKAKGFAIAEQPCPGLLLAVKGGVREETHPFALPYRAFRACLLSGSPPICPAPVASPGAMRQLSRANTRECAPRAALRYYCGTQRLLTSLRSELRSGAYHVAPDDVAPGRERPA